MFIQYLFSLTGILYFNGIFAIPIVDSSSSEINNSTMYEDYIKVFCVNSQDLKNSCILAQAYLEMDETNVEVYGEFLFDPISSLEKGRDPFLVYAIDKIPVETQGLLESRLLTKILKGEFLTNDFSTTVHFDLAWEKEHNDMGCLKIYNGINSVKKVVVKTSCNDFLKTFVSYCKRNIC